jgi:hypothetical protein
MGKANGVVPKCSSRTAVMSGTATTAVSDVIDFTDYALGGIAITSTGAFTGSPKLAYKVCDTSTGTFMNLYTSTGGLVETPIAVNKKAQKLPYELYGWPYFRMWFETSGSGIAQAVTYSFIVTLKS